MVIFVRDPSGQANARGHVATIGVVHTTRAACWVAEPAHERVLPDKMASSLMICPISAIGAMASARC
jgi:hypothetical protein